MTAVDPKHLPDYGTTDDIPGPPDDLRVIRRSHNLTDDMLAIKLPTDGKLHSFLIGMNHRMLVYGF